MTDYENCKSQLSSVTKKTPPENTIASLNSIALQFKEKNQVQQQEHLVIFEVLPLNLQRLNDNPKIFELGQEVCRNIVSNLSIQAFPLVMDIIFSIIK